jgi:hypothetical protein
MFAVFIIKAGRWEMWSIHNSLTEAKREETYLCQMLGVEAKAFVKQPQK